MQRWTKNMLFALAIVPTMTIVPRLEAKETKATQMKPFTFPAAKYADFALSKDAKTWDFNHPENQQMLQEGNGQPLRVIETNKAEKWVQVYAVSCQNVLKMPFGWFGLDDGSTTYFWTPDEKTRIISAFDLISPEDNPPPAGQTHWGRFKANVLEQMKKQMPGATFRQFDLAGESFGIEATDIKSESKRDVSFVQVWQHNPEIPQFALSLSLTSPAKDYQHNLGLIGLIVRDRQIQWGN